MIEFSTVRSPLETDQIIALQAENHLSVLSTEQTQQQGFLTVRHDPDVLRRMNTAKPSIIAKDGAALAGFALVMPREFAPEVPILLPMFDMLGTLSWQGRPLRDSPRWFVMGQVCVAEAYRGQGVFDGLYAAMRAQYRDQYDFVVTEIAERNQRSMRAHERVGFKPLHVYPDASTGETWHVVVWDF
jgi:GNAT superfamily N-acetyltransferase